MVDLHSDGIFKGSDASPGDAVKALKMPFVKVIKSKLVIEKLAPADRERYERLKAKLERGGLKASKRHEIKTRLAQIKKHSGKSGGKELLTLPDEPFDGSITYSTGKKGWKVGEPYNNLNRDGSVPSWWAVRRRIWKNVANDPEACKKYIPPKENEALMKKGKAPMVEERGKLVRVELHHDPFQTEGNLFDVVAMTPDEHERAEKDLRDKEKQNKKES